MYLRNNARFYGGAAKASCPQRARKAHPYDEGIKMNPTEIGPGKGPLEPEPAWIRDNQIPVNFDAVEDSQPPAKWIAEICAGEKTYCEHCGAEFPLWPTKGWSDHALTAHAELVTMQARTGAALMCEDAINQPQATFFAMNFAQRVSMRRRAFHLGYAQADGEKSPIHLPS
jgi:hypothetical protein